jgi:hypothetical protein
MWGRCRSLAVLAAVIVAAGCGGPPAPPAAPPLRWDARPVRASHPGGRVLVEFPGFLEPQAANDRVWLHVTYKAKDAWLSVVFLRDCLEPGPEAKPCPEVNGCAFLPGTTALLPLGRERGRLLEIVRTHYFWNTNPPVCARVNLRVATRRPEYDRLAAFVRELPTRIRILRSRGLPPASRAASTE